MVLNEGQAEAVEKIAQRYKDGKSFAVLAGPAGSGKTTTVAAIIAALPDVDPEEDVVYCAYTGRATEILKKKGNNNTSTLHKLLYESHLNPDGSYSRRKVKFIPYKVVVIDECSMVPPDMVTQLASYRNIFCLFLGDQAQLPPINEDANNGLLIEPHYVLTQIMRQAEGGEIIDLATKIRTDSPIDYFTGEEVQVLPNNSLSDGMLLWADIILCATNKTRHYINERVRKLKGYDSPLVEGEKIICLKNNWDVFGSDMSPLVNGQIGYINSEFNEFEGKLPYVSGVRGAIPFYKFDFQTDIGENFFNLKVDKNIMLYEKPSITSAERYTLLKKKFKYLLPNEFTYAYAITVHKSQGGEFPKVLVIEESFPFDKVEHRRWLYTAVTRAASKLVLIRK